MNPCRASSAAARLKSPSKSRCATRPNAVYGVFSLAGKPGTDDVNTQTVPSLTDALMPPSLPGRVNRTRSPSSRPAAQPRAVSTSSTGTSRLNTSPGRSVRVPPAASYCGGRSGPGSGNSRAGLSGSSASRYAAAGHASHPDPTRTRPGPPTNTRTACGAGRATGPRSRPSPRPTGTCRREPRRPRRRRSIQLDGWHKLDRPPPNAAEIFNVICRSDRCAMAELQQGHRCPSVAGSSAIVSPTVDTLTISQHKHRDRRSAFQSTSRQARRTRPPLRGDSPRGSHRASRTHRSSCTTGWRR